MQALDAHTRRALIEAARDLSDAAVAAVERATDQPSHDEIGTALAIYDLLDSARRAVSRIGVTP